MLLINPSFFQLKFFFHHQKDRSDKTRDFSRSACCNTGVVFPTYITPKNKNWSVLRTTHLYLSSFQKSCLFLGNSKRQLFAIYSQFCGYSGKNALTQDLVTTTEHFFIEDISGWICIAMYTWNHKIWYPEKIFLSSCHFWLYQNSTLIALF